MIEEATAEGETAAAYQYFRDTMGRQKVPGLLKCFSTNPDAARSMVDMGSAILFRDGHLSRRQKEMIATHISAINNCAYCLDSHAHAFVLQGATTETARAVACRRLPEAEIAAREVDLLRFTSKLNTDSSGISDHDIQHLRQSGWTDEQIAETVHVAALMGFCNRVANAFGLSSQGLSGFVPDFATGAPLKWQH